MTGTAAPGQQHNGEALAIAAGFDFGLYDARLVGTRTAPVMPARDLARSAAFYERLGFTAALITGPPGYLIVRNGWVEMHFYPDDAVAPLTNASGAYIRLADVDAAVLAILGLLPEQGSPRFHPPRDRPWGLREAYSSTQTAT